MHEGTHRVQLDEAVGDLTKHLVLGEVSHAIRAGHERVDEGTS